MHNHIGYSREREMAERAKAPTAYVPTVDVISAEDVAVALTGIEDAIDSRGMSAALMRPAFKQFLILLQMGKVGASDLIRFMSMSADRVDGKVADKVDISSVHTSVQTMTDDDRAILERYIAARSLAAPIHLSSHLDVDSVSVGVVDNNTISVTD